MLFYSKTQNESHFLHVNELVAKGRIRTMVHKGVVDYLDDFTYKGTYLLVAEDGENLRSRKQPIARIVSGEFRVNNYAHVLRGTDKCDICILAWLLNEMNISAYVTGAAQPKLSQKNLLSIELELPTTDSQRTILRLLNPISEKIQLNQRTNDYLTALLDTKFNEFISHKSSDWTSASLLDIASYKNGLAMQKFRPTGDDAGLPVLKIRELGQGYCGSDAERCRSEIDESVLIHDGDLVFSWSGTLLLDFWAGGDAGLNQHLFKVTSDRHPSWFYYSWTKHHMRRFVSIAKDRATTMGHIKRSALQDSEVFIPHRDEMQVLTTRMQPLVDELINRRIESRTLAECRDALLSKLISGEVDVSQIELPTQPNNHLSSWSVAHAKHVTSPIGTNLLRPAMISVAK